jgi:phosphoribosylformimino-5-aminoimidazole carboxamide ribotide isomerase
MHAKTFVIPLVAVRDGQAELPPKMGPEAGPAQYATPDAVAKKWVSLGARRLYFLDADGHNTNHGAITKAVNSIHGRAQVDVEGGITSLAELTEAVSGGAHHAVVDATVPWLADAIKQHGNAIAVKVGIHESMLSSHATSRDGSDLWTRLEEIEDLGVDEYVILNTDRHGHWRHKSLHVLAAVCESVKPPVITLSGVTHLEDLHQLVGLSSDGLVGTAVDTGLYSGAFTLSEGKAAIEPRYDPYIWAPPSASETSLGDV